MIIQRNVDFVKNINTPTVSKSYFNANSDVLSLHVYGTFSSGLVFIEGRTNKESEWVKLAAINLSDFSAVREGITKAGLYELGIASVRELRARVESIAGGNMTLFGQIISTEET